MKIKQDPVTGLYCREDGAVLLPPCRKFPHFRWTFGTLNDRGYLRVGYHGKSYAAHQIVCRAFNGPPPAGKFEIDHISRIKVDNSPTNLRYADSFLNNTNKDYVDKSIAKYGVRECEDRKAYGKAYREAHPEECKAHYAAYAAGKKAQGLTKRKGPDGKYGWYPI